MSSTRTKRFPSPYASITRKELGFQLPRLWSVLGTPPFVQPYFELGRFSYSYSNSNRTVGKAAGGTYDTIVAGSAKSSGKWYIEFLMENASGPTPAADWKFGIATSGSSNGLGSYASSIGIRNGEASSTGFTGIGGITQIGVVPNPSAIIGIAYDADARKLWVGVNGVYASSGDPAAGANPNASGWSNGLSLFPAIQAYSNFATTMTIPTSWTYKPAGFSDWA